MRVHWGQASSVGQIARYKLDHALLGPIFELATRTGNQYAIPLGNQSYFSILHAGENCLLLRTLRTFLLVTHLSLLLVIVATSFYKVKLKWDRRKYLVHDVDLGLDLEIFDLIDLVKAHVAVKRGSNDREHLLLDFGERDDLLVAHHTVLAVLSLVLLSQSQLFI